MVALENLYMRLLLLITLLLFAGRTTGQTAGFKEPTPKEEFIIELANECFNTNTYSPSKRLAIYPFNKARSIKLISFKEDEFIPVQKKIVDYSKVLESHVLGADETNELTKILYNMGYNPHIKPIFRIESNYKCYEPRNGILFLDAAGKAFEFIEICFECHRTKASSNKVIQGTFCGQKISLIKDFFHRAGIQYGTSSRYGKTTYAEILKLDSVEMLQALQEKLEDKVINGDNVEQLNAMEKKLMILLNSRALYRADIQNSGFATFYFKYTGGFYPQTAALLAEIGATETLAAFKSSLQQWPGGIVPSDRPARLKLLLKIADKAVPKWKDIEKGLYTYKMDTNAQVLTCKEDLDGLILKYIMAHKNDLQD
ncbi:DUF4375 domain-containing protein [Pedobacter nutrimenti]|uniref:DMP19 family protein n=1 Tax=Pedobacter nutrimenti TaxID=1241337 RepID=UPI0029308BA9|nr:DUF4375 domain-containing protein [Pedobacter nutrimenti]